MREYFTEAVVLDKEPLYEIDERVFLYTKDLGKVVAKVTSGRRITSKLSPHLEPLNLVKVRLVYKNSFQVADVLKFGKLSHNNFNLLRLVKNSVINESPDQELWEFLYNSEDSSIKALTILGFNPSFAKCQVCGGDKLKFFIFEDGAYLCRACMVGFSNPERYLDFDSLKITA